MGDRPPPPPPHGGVPKSSGLPPGKYDIFVIPEHSSGAGFLYLPSLQPNVNSFAAGFASALILVVVGHSLAPAFKVWWEGFQGLGNVGIALLTVGVGISAWALGRTQGTSLPRHGQGAAYGGPGGPGGSGGWKSYTGGVPDEDGPPPPPPPHGTPPSGGARFAGGDRPPPPPPHGTPPGSQRQSFGSQRPSTDSPRPSFGSHRHSSSWQKPEWTPEPGPGTPPPPPAET